MSGGEEVGEGVPRVEEWKFELADDSRCRRVGTAVVAAPSTPAPRRWLLVLIRPTG